jgi:MYXO-CTERM domain-containing protein
MKLHPSRSVAALGPVVLAALFAGAALSAPSGASAASPLPSGAPAATTAMVPLAGSLHPLARPEADVGRMDPGVRLSGLSLLFRASPTQKAAIARTLTTLQDPASPLYHHWLTPEDYAARFGASPPDVARATAWLQSQGLSVDGPSRMSTRLTFSGSVGQLEHAFATEMHHYAGDDGKTHFAMSRAPSVPADLGDLVLGLHGAHDYRVEAPPHPLYALPGAALDGGIGPAIAPADFAQIYDVASLYAAGINGAGQHIAIAGQTDFNDADIAAFRTQFALPASTPTRVVVPYSGSPFVSAGDLTESELDLEWSGAVAPGATIDFVFTGDNPNYSVFDAMIYAIEQRTAPILSVSYGQCETQLAPADAAFEEALGDAAAMIGMTVLAATGDTGAAGCDSQRSTAARHGLEVGLPASIPTVVAVGGTQLDVTPANQATYLDGQDNALGYIPESGWNETQIDIEAGFGGLGASTGGASVIFPKPYWQTPYTPKDSARDLPDVSLSASAVAMPYAVSYSWTAADGDAQAPMPQTLEPVGGTSAATPSFAGILALVNQALATKNPNAQVGLGNANPILYALANNTASAGAFHDITTGDNIVPCMQGTPSCPTTAPYQFGYTCAPGYDQVTGLGTIDAAKLVAAWQELTPTSTTLVVNESGTTEGSPLQLTATIASTATSTPLTGEVTFYYETFDGDGGIDLGGALGSSTIMATTSGMEGATATLSAKAPAGYTGQAKIAAFYGGDLHYLASWSTLSLVQATSTLKICPTAVTLLPGQTGFTFTTSGGSAPVSWQVLDDSTCQRINRVETCSSIDGGVFTAGPTTGTATVAALDVNEAYVTATVTVAGSADAGTPLPVVSCSGDAGVVTDASSDATVTDASDDAASESPGGSSSKGCGCETAGAEQAAGATWLGLGLVGLGVARRRKRA